MSLTFNQFNVMNALSENPGATQRELSEAASVSLASVNATLKECANNGYID